MPNNLETIALLNSKETEIEDKSSAEVRSELPRQICEGNKGASSCCLVRMRSLEERDCNQATSVHDTRIPHLLETASSEEPAD